jgi:hypothetical protein
MSNNIADSCNMCELLGRRTIEKLEKCKYCGGTFCIEHILTTKELQKMKNEKLIFFYQPYAGHRCRNYETGDYVHGEVKPETKEEEQERLKRLSYIFNQIEETEKAKEEKEKRKQNSLVQKIKRKLKF